MNKSSGRILSLMLTVIMILSSVMMMNVSCVFAASTTISNVTTINSNVTYWFDDATNNGTTEISGNQLFGNNYFFTPKGHTVSTNKGSVEGHLNCLRLKNKTNYFGFKVGGAYSITFYTEKHASRGIVISSGEPAEYGDYNAAVAGKTAANVQPVNTTSFTYNASKAETIYVASYGGDFYISGIEIIIPEDGDISLADDCNMHGTVTLSDANGDLTLQERLSANTDVTVTITADSGYVPSAAVGGKAIVLSKNGNIYTGNFKVTGDAEIAVSYKERIARTPITKSIEYKHTADTDKYVLAYNTDPVSDYYFELTNGATIISSTRINVGGGDFENKSILFSTGDFGGKQAKMVVNYASSGTDGERFLSVNGDHDTTGSSSTSKNSKEYILEPNTDYYIASALKSLYIYSITITVASEVYPVIPDEAPKTAYYVGFDAKDGYKTYGNVAAALEAAPANSIIYIYPGTYEEKLNISKQNISLINWAVTEYWKGEEFAAKSFSGSRVIDVPSAANPAVVLTHKYAVTTDTSYEFYAGTQQTATVTAESGANGFSAKGITFQNSYNLSQNNKIERAVALVTMCDKVELINCRFLSVQDTLYLKTGTGGSNHVQKNVYLKDCYAEGGVDFMFGDATAFFDNCKLHMSSTGYYTAANTYIGTVGYVYSSCTFTKASGITAHMGRSWQTLYSATKTEYNTTSSNVVLVKCSVPTLSEERYTSMGGGSDYTEAPERTRYYEDSSTYNSSSKFAYDKLISNGDDYTAKNVVGYDNGTWTAPSKALSVAFTNGDGTEMYNVSLNAGETRKLIAKAVPFTVEDTIVWSSSKPNVATVTDGVVKAVGVGKCEIYATASNGQKAVSYVSVADPNATTRTIDFKNDYSTYNNSSNYKNGAYKDLTGITLYSDGVRYNDHSSYGIVVQANKKIISFPADEKADYIISVTISNDGKGTVGVYTDSSLQKIVASKEAAPSTTTEITYTNTDTSNVIYVAFSANSNAYVSKITVTKQSSAPEGNALIKGTNAAVNGNSVCLLASVAADDCENIKTIGFVAAPTAFAAGEEIASYENVIKSEGTTVYSAASVNGTEITAASLNGDYLYADKIYNVPSNVKTIYYAAFTTDADNNIVYDTVKTAEINAVS